MALDSMELDALHLLKIDVDGGELEVLKSGEMQIERFRPTLYFEDERREQSAPLLAYAMGMLKYDLCFHRAPIFEADNFFGNPVNRWGNVGTLMIVGPKERRIALNLKRVTSAEDWCDFTGSDDLAAARSH